MNSKTAKLINKAARVQAHVQARNMPEDGVEDNRTDKDREKQRLKINAQLQQRFKAQWTGTPKNQRGVLRRKLEQIVRECERELLKDPG